MKIHKERFDESCGTDESGGYFCIHKGVVVTIEKEGRKLLFRLDDSEPRVATLLEPRGWYLDLWGSRVFQEAVVYLQRVSNVVIVRAYNQMTGGVYEYQIDTAQADEV